MDNKKENENYKFKIAIASSDGVVVNRHFGRAERFLIYGLKEGEEINLLEERNVEPVCNGGTHDVQNLQKNAQLFTDCKYLLASKIGQGAANMLEYQGIIPMELPGLIEDSIKQLLVYEELQNLFA